MNRKKLSLFLLVLLLAYPLNVLSENALSTNSGIELVFGIHPFMQATDLLHRFSPLAEYLSEASGRPIRIKISKDYQKHIQAVGEGQVDIAYLGPAPYVQVVKNYGLMPILAKLEVNGKGDFRGVIIVRQESKLETLGDLAGKNFAFGDPGSTMSHILPLYTLFKAGVGIKQLGGVEHLNNHRSVALAVLLGMSDAGGIQESVFLKNRQRGLKSLAYTAPVSNHVFVARGDMPQSTVRILRKAMLTLDSDTEGLKILHSIKPSVTSLLRGKNSDFDELRDILQTLSNMGAYDET